MPKQLGEVDKEVKSRFQHIHRKVLFTSLDDDTPFYSLFRFENKD